MKVALLVVAALANASAFAPPPSGLKFGTSLNMERGINGVPLGPVHTLILTRHGDSYWNGKYPGCRETFTGWTDVDLSPIGVQEAIRTGKLLSQQTSGVNIDALFTSSLTRAKITAHHCWWAYYDRLEEHYQKPKAQMDSIIQDYQPPSQFIMDHRLNERHYGSLQGLVKNDAEIGLHGHSPEDVYQWRRAWHAVPPPLDEEDPRRQLELRKYGNICGVENVPRSESLAMVAQNRIRPFLDDKLTPVLNNAGQSKEEGGGTALVVAHANSLRALIGVLCNVEQDTGSALMRLERMKIPTASPMFMKYRQNLDDGSYVAVDCKLGSDVKNDLPVYPLSSLSLVGRQFSRKVDTNVLNEKSIGVNGQASVESSVQASMV